MENKEINNNGAEFEPVENENKKNTTKKVVKYAAIAVALIGTGIVLGNKSARTKIAGGIKGMFTKKNNAQVINEEVALEETTTEEVEVQQPKDDEPVDNNKQERQNNNGNFRKGGFRYNNNKFNHNN